VALYCHSATVNTARLVFDPMTRLELLHTIQDNAEALPLTDAVSLVAGRLGDLGDAWQAPEVLAAWERFTKELEYCLWTEAQLPDKAELQPEEITDC
jgi:hypothetical protein